jgi:hypothetical protein
VFHVCCEPITRETILDWMQRNGVRIPVGMRRSERSVIWFGDREPLVKAGKGYVVISTNTFPGQYLDYYRKMRPESLVDPFTDRHFSLRAVIDARLGNSYRIYSFDFSG